ncbi:hypothetical protein S479_23705 [Salmonella enterica subsp. enterica serovar Newport]|nr:hypothetical protein [Salmonella enterica]EEK2703114.1 hypothetical protein [Salmonella enterica subsp. enterica serovar Newport]
MSSYPVGMWRVPSPQIINGKYFSLIVDSGDLKKAITDSKNNYLFAESKDGFSTEAIKPLAFIGTLSELTIFLMMNKDKKVVNLIPQLKYLYIGMSKYKPVHRFSGVFPVQDVGVKLFSQLISIYPDLSGLKVPVFIESAGIPGTLKELVESITKMKTSDDTNAKSEDIYFLKISYLPEDGMMTIFNNTLSFSQLLNILNIGGSRLP